MAKGKPTALATPSPQEVVTRVGTPATQDVVTRVTTRVGTTLDLSEPLRAFLAEAGRPGAAQITCLDEAEQVFRQHQQAETASRVMQGWVLASVKALGDESLRALSTRVDTSKDRVHQLIAYFHLFQAVPDLDSVRRCAHLEFTLAREVAKWPQQEQIAFCGGEEVRGVTIEQARDMTSREFIEATKRAGSDEVRAERALRIQAEERAAQAEFERDQLKAKPFKPSLLAETLEVRGEAAALTQQMDLCVDSLDRVYHDLLVKPSIWGAHHQDQRQLAAGTYFHRLYAVHQRIAQLLSLCEADFGEGVCGDNRVVFSLSGEEMLTLTERFKRMALAAAGQAEARRIQREEFPDGRARRKVGRPKGSKTGARRG